MIHRVAIILSGLLIMSVVFMISLIALASGLRNRAGSFHRIFPPHPVVESSAIDLGVNSYYLAGASRFYVYLANYTAPRIILLHGDTGDTTHVSITLDGPEDIIKNLRQVRIVVDSPYFYVADGTLPVVFRGMVDTWNASVVSYQRAHFIDYVPDGGDRIIFRALGEPVGENVLGWQHFVEDTVVIHDHILEKQVDGIFCTSGMLQQATDGFIYLYRYRNEYIVLDSLLHVTQRGKTIDTTSHAAITVRQHSKTRDIYLTSLENPINQFMSVDASRMYIHSTVLANNEHPKALDHASVIDVYQFQAGAYRHSFYLYHFKGKEKLRQFVVRGNKLYALFQQHVMVYTIGSNYL